MFHPRNFDPGTFECLRPLMSKTIFKMKLTPLQDVHGFSIFKKSDYCYNDIEIDTDTDIE